MNIIEKLQKMQTEPKIRDVWIDDFFFSAYSK